MGVKRFIQNASLLIVLLAVSVAILAPSTRAFAFEISPMLGLELGAGEGSATLPSDSTQPKLGDFSVGAAFELHIMSHIVLGADTDYSLFGQYSSVDPTVGNRRGTYFNPIAPLFGLCFGPVVIKADYRFKGSYDLSNVNVALQSISYNSPGGGRVSLGVMTSEHMRIGVSYEKVDFGQETIQGVTTTLGQKFTLWQAGVLVGFFL